MKDLTLSRTPGSDMNTEMTPNTDAGREFCRGIFGAGTLGGSISPQALQVYVDRAHNAGLTIGTN